MSYFLFKTEPTEYSFDDLIKDGRTVWDGVKNPLAQKFIKTIKSSDKVFIYHTGNQKQIVGLAQVINDPYIYKSGLFVVDIKPIIKFKRFLPLSEIKKMEEFKDFYLVKLPRLSVMPVDDLLANLIISLTQG